MSEGFEKQFDFSEHYAAVTVNPTLGLNLVSCAAGRSHVMNISNQLGVSDMESCSQRVQLQLQCSDRLLKDVLGRSGVTQAQSLFHQLTNP